MENVQARKEELQGFIDSRKQQLAEGVSLSAQGVINSEITAFETEIAAIDTQAEQEAAQQVRVAAQVEKVESIVLPFDFNDIFENAKANDMIIEVVKEFQRKAYEDHNTEIQTVTGTHKEEIRASGERELQLKHQNDELQQAHSSFVNGHDAVVSELQREISQLRLEKEDAYSKRDAAFKKSDEYKDENDQLKKWNDDLRQQLEFGVRKAINIIDISPSDKLAAMVKETEEIKANRALERWSKIMPEVVAPPVVAAEAATFQPEHTQASDHPSELVHTADPAVSTQDGVNHFRHNEGTVSPEVQVAIGNETAPVAGETVSRSEFEALKSRVSFIEAHGNIPTNLRPAV